MRRNSFMSKGKRIGKIARGPEYRMDEPFQNVLIFGIFIVFQIEKILKIC